jgi:phosphoribosylformylglycinamidine cyclo-ligase
MRYAVDYKALDRFKRASQVAARTTSANLADLGFHVVEESRGESSFVIDEGDRLTAHVIEGLGTANRVAEAFWRRTGKSLFRAVAQSAAAMALNDLGVCGARPVSLCMYIAVGREEYFSPSRCRQDIIAGWQIACNTARCAWGGGETPRLRDIILPDTCDLGGSAYGVINPRTRLISGDVQVGDAIVFVAATGPHANGFTLIRDIVPTLRNRYRTLVDGDITFAEAALAPTPIYTPLIQAALDRGFSIHRVENITGHGWRKIMRGNGNFTYVIDRLPRQLPIFDFIRVRGKQSVRDMFSTFNMGAGLAIFLPKNEADGLIARFGIQWGLSHGGHVEAGPKQVVIRPANVTFKGKTLRVR